MCFEQYYKDPDFFFNLYDHRDDPRRMNWARIVRTFRESGGDVNYKDQYRNEMILQFNCIGDILTPDVVNEFITQGFTFDNKTDIGSYGRIGAWGAHYGNPLKIDAMEIICRKFNWIEKVSDSTIKYNIFGINGHSEDFSNYFLEFKTTRELVEMHLRNDHWGRVGKVWKSLPHNVKKEMPQQVQDILTSFYS